MDNNKVKNIVGAAIINCSEYREKVFIKDRNKDAENCLNARTYLRDLVKLVPIVGNFIWVGEVIGGVFFDNGEEFWGFYPGAKLEEVERKIFDSFYDKVEKSVENGNTITGFPIDFALTQINEAIAKYEEINGDIPPRNLVEKWGRYYGLTLL